MNTTLSTTAWVLHDLGLATSVGGGLFGKTGLRASAQAGIGKTAQPELMNDAWKYFTPINLVSHVAVALTWLAGRSKLSGSELGRSAHRAVLAKDALVGIYLASGLGATAAGYAFDRAKKADEDQADLDTGGSEARRGKFLRASGRLGTVNLVAGIGLIGLTTLLAMQSGRSARWSFLSRFLP
jgi:hypothetical protein